MAPSGEAFVDYPPAARFLHPVLAFTHAVRGIAAGVVLVERDDGEPLLARIQKHAHAIELHFDPAFAGIHVLLLVRIAGEILLAGGESLRVVRKEAARIE